jgi:hypothetical protein
MTMLLELDPETEDRLKTQAMRRGVAPEQYAGEFLRDNLPNYATGTGKLTQEDFRSMMKELQEGSENLPSLPTSAFSRESIYQDHA